MLKIAEAGKVLRFNSVVIAASVLFQGFDIIATTFLFNGADATLIVYIGSWI